MKDSLRNRKELRKNLGSPLLQEESKCHCNISWNDGGSGYGGGRSSSSTSSSGGGGGGGGGGDGGGSSSHLSFVISRQRSQV